MKPCLRLDFLKEGTNILHMSNMDSKRETKKKGEYYHMILIYHL